MIEGREVEIEVEMEKMPAEVKPASSWHGPLVSKPVSWGSGGAWQEEEDQGLLKKEVRLLIVFHVFMGNRKRGAETQIYQHAQEILGQLINRTMYYLK